MPDIRIISGELKGRVLARGAERAYRPMSGRARQALFNMLAQRLAGSSFLDLYAGSGALGLEAHSRGAASVTFVERQAGELSGTLEELGLELELLEDDVAAALALLAAQGRRFDLIVADPPYEAQFLPAPGQAAAALLKEGGKLVYSHSARNPAPPSAGSLKLEKSTRLGDTSLSIYYR